MSDNQENWKFVTGTNQSYQISDLGNVKGKKKKLLKPTLKNIGYLKVGFSLGNRKIINRYIHHLVAQEFLNHNFSNKDFVINHINENKLDNRLTNLEIVSRKENAKHWAKKNRSYNSGRKRSGFCGRGHRLKENQYHCNICRSLLKKEKPSPPKDFKWKETGIEGYLISDNGKIWSKKRHRLINTGINTPGYVYANLRVNNKTKNFAVSRLVYSVFKSAIPDNLIVDHINENKLDNRIQNLRILSRRENSLASKNEMKKRNKHGFKLNEKNVGEIKWLFEKSKMKKKEIAEIYNISLSHLYEIGGGNKWGHIEPKKPYFNDIKET